MSLSKLGKKYGVSKTTAHNYLRGHEYTWRPKSPRELFPCGTDAGYARHLRAKEQPCLECCDAHALEVERVRRVKRHKEEQAK